MKNYLNKELMAKVGTIYEETPDDNPCGGQQTYLALKFIKEEVFIVEKYISSCDKESILIIGTYKWKLRCTKKIKIDYIQEEVKGTYTEDLSLELRDKQLIGRIKHLNGKIVEYTFLEKTK